MRLLLPFLMFYFFFASISPHKGYAQHRCATTEAMQKMYKQDANLEKSVTQHLSQLYQTANQKVLQKKQGEACSSGDWITIPVVVHVLYDPHDPSSNLSDAQIASQICQLNADYGGSNQDLIEALDEDGDNDLHPALANATSQGTCIRFCLASFNHPQSTVLNPNGLVDGQEAIIRRSLDGLPTDFPADFIGIEGSNNDVWEISPIWDRNEYLNFWVVPSIDQNRVLGLAQLPKGSFLTDGVIIRARNFGAASPDCGACEDCLLQEEYDMGRTATHEVGHWLGLLHPWGTEDKTCSEELGDGIADTPNQFTNSEYLDCDENGFPVRGDLCTSEPAGGIMYMNYMDYSADACLILFSEGQQAAMEETLRNGFRSGFSRNNLEEVKCAPANVLPPIAKFSYAPNPALICNTNGKIQFTNTSENYPTQWQWSFEAIEGDLELDVFSSNVKHPTLKVLSGTSGRIEATLSVANTLAEDAIEEVLSVNLTEEACPSCEGSIFAGEDITICPDETWTLHADLGSIYAIEEEELECRFLRWEVSGVEVGTDASLEVNLNSEGVFYYTAIAECGGFICTDEVAVSVFPHALSGVSTMVNTAENPFEVCGDELSFELTSTGPYHYDANIQTIAWGIWVIEDPFGQTAVGSNLLPASPPNDSDVSDDENFVGFYGTNVEGATGEGTVELFVFGNGATYYFAPIIINQNNSYTPKCAAVSSQGTYVKQYLPLSAEIDFNSCVEESMTRISFNGGLPLNDFTRYYVLTLTSDDIPYINLIPIEQRNVSWHDAVIDFPNLPIDDYIVNIKDDLGCQVEQTFSLLDCEVDVWSQIGNVNGPSVQLFTDRDNRMLEAADDFWVSAEEGIRVDAIEVTGSFSRTNVARVNSVQVKISIDDSNRPGSTVVLDVQITPDDPFNPNFHLPLEESLELPPNKYWISIVPEMSSIAYGQWFWNATNIQSGEKALYKDASNLLGQGFEDWVSVNGNAGNPAAIDLSFSLLSNASAGMVDALQNQVICCDESVSLEVNQASYDCTSFGLAWALASTNDRAGVELAIAEGNAWFGDEEDVYELSYDCMEGFEEGSYYAIPFLANKYEEKPSLVEGCDHATMGEGLEIIWKNCNVCTANAGVMPTEEQWICYNERTHLTTSNENLSAGDVLTYVLHDSPTATLGEILAENETGRFEVTDVPNANVSILYYVSAVVGADFDGDGMPDLEDPCTVIAAGTPVRFLNDFSFEVVYDVSESPNRVDATFTIRGGVSELNNSLYTVHLSDVGTIENVTHGAPFTIEALPNGANLTLEIEDENNCSNAFEFTDIEGENKASFSLTLQPNPAKDFLQLNFKSPITSMATVRVYGVDGRLILQQSQQGKAGENTMELDLQPLASGMYFLSLGYGGNWVNRKVVKGN